ncbi:MAG: hypothetical protein MUQ56_00860, partial [Thermoleophilia bacterium]|nr:hypothetical protein [Thermoleophilia bacterium]
MIRLLTGLWVVVLAIGCISGAECACDIQVTSAEVVGADGTTLPRVGETYVIRVEYVVHGTPSANFRIHFSLANTEGDYTDIQGADGGSYYWVWGVNCDLDGPIPWSVTVDPENLSGD